MLSQIIGELLPFALAIAVSPLSIVAVILLLLSPNARGAGPGFLIGWSVGIAVPSVIFVFLGGTLLPSPGHNSADPVRAVIQFAFAALLLLLAGKQWQSRPAPGADPALPKWMSAIDSFGFGRALGLGLLLSLPRPKNLIMAASAGMIIGGAGLAVTSAVVATGVFILCAISTVLIPVVAYLIASDRLRTTLETIHGWLARENAVITSVLLLVLSTLLLGKALGSL